MTAALPKIVQAVSIYGQLVVLLSNGQVWKRFADADWRRVQGLPGGKIHRLVVDGGQLILLMERGSLWADLGGGNWEEQFLPTGWAHG